MGFCRLPTGLLCALGLAAGIHLGPEMAPVLRIAPGLLGALLLILPNRAARGTGGFPIPAILGVLLAAGAAGALRSEAPASFPRRERARLAGRVLAWEWSERGVGARLRVHAVDGRILEAPRVVRVYAPASWGRVPASDWVCGEGRLEPERGATVPGARNDRTLSGHFVADRDLPPQWGPAGASRWFTVREGLVVHLERELTGFPRRFAIAILLGRARSLTPEEAEIFRRTGTSHLIAVSGLHVTLMAGMAALLVAGFPRRRRWIGAAGAACLYAVVAGGSPSVVRAAAIATGASVGAALHRPRPAPAWLALALPWLLWSSPSFLHSVGFQLSVTAVAGILFANDLLSPWLRGRAALLGPLVVSLGAQWGTLAPLVGTFGAVSPFALLPNALVVPGAALVLPSTVFGLLAALAGWAGNPFFDAAQGVAAGMLAFLRECERVLPYRTGLPAPGPLPAILGMGLVAAWFSLGSAYRARPGIRRAVGSLALLAPLPALFPPGPPPGPWVAFLDVGQGDAAVFRLRDGTVWVVDVGDDRGPGDAARRAILPFLRNRRIRKVDGLVVSHRHRDHVGGLASFLEGIPVEHVFDAGVGPPGGTSGVVDSLLHAHRRWPCLVAAGDTLHSGGGGRVLAVHPPRPDPGGGGHRFRSLNDASLVLEVRDGPMEILFAGDMEASAEVACVAGSGIRPVALLKVPHHGSRTSSTPELIRAAHPDRAIVSVGEGNRFDHPAPEVLERYRESGVDLLRTDRDGSVLLGWGQGSARIVVHPPRASQELP